MTKLNFRIAKSQELKRGLDQRYMYLVDTVSKKKDEISRQNMKQSELRQKIGVIEDVLINTIQNGGRGKYAENGFKHVKNEPQDTGEKPDDRGKALISGKKTDSKPNLGCSENRISREKNFEADQDQKTSLMISHQNDL